MSVAGAICGWLAKQDGARTMAEIRAAILPDASAARMHNHLGPLVRTGKLKQVAGGHGRRGGSAYVVGDVRDRRYRKPTIAQRPTFDRKPAHGPIDVAADVRAFLAAGGKVQRLSRYDTSRPFKRIHPERVPNLGTSVPDLRAAA